MTNIYLKRIGDLRDSADLTQQEVTEYLHVNQKTYSEYERGEINIPMRQLIKLANFYQVSLDYLVGRSQNPNRLK